MNETFEYVERRLSHSENGITKKPQWNKRRFYTVESPRFSLAPPSL
jgi:hypothetical protein